jgi:2-polyprenyl-6-methoxyphenol hydroxylase-like FAD-dependent oxidoreductase
LRQKGQLERAGGTVRVDCEVIVAGGGPTGLLSAFLCAEAGITARVFETAPVLGKDLRASSFHPPTLDMLEDFGVTEALVARGLVCPNWQIRIHPSGERAVFELASIAGETRHPYRLQCEQWKLSEELLARLRDHPRADVQFNATVVDFVDDGETVTVTIDGSGGRQIVRSRILVGADGLRSEVRHKLGLLFEGETYPETTIVVTTPFRFEDHIDGMSLVTSCYVGNSHIAFLRLPDLWRLALYPDETLPIEEQLKQPAIEAALQLAVETSTPYPIQAIWPYRVQQRIVPTYRVGRVALVGDAAHVNSPAGGMGLNAGIHDAFELAAALTAIIKDGAPLERLDLYDRRRRPVVAEHILGLAARNRARMRVTDTAARQEEIAKLRAIAANPEKHKAFVMRASMIDGLRQAASVV